MSAWDPTVQFSADISGTVLPMLCRMVKVDSTAAKIGAAYSLASLLTGIATLQRMAFEAGLVRCQIVFFKCFLKIVGGRLTRCCPFSRAALKATTKSSNTSKTRSGP